MPKKLEKELRAEAKKKGLSGAKADAYVYGALRKTGWKPSKTKRKKIDGYTVFKYKIHQGRLRSFSAL